MATGHTKTTITRVTADTAKAAGVGLTYLLADTQYGAIQISVTGVGDKEEVRVVNARDAGYAANVVGTINGTVYTAAAPLAVNGIGHNVRLLADAAGNIRARPASVGL